MDGNVVFGGEWHWSISFDESAFGGEGLKLGRERNCDNKFKLKE